MPRFAANLSLLFDEHPFLERFAAAAAAGFTAVEVQFPYDHPAEEIAARLRAHALTLVTHNLPAGDWARGERGIACLPDRTAEFRAGIQLAIGYARAVGVRQVNCLAGIPPPGQSPEISQRTLVENLRHAAQLLGDSGIGLSIEAINSRDVPGFFVDTSRHALEILDAVDSANLRLQFDVYHRQVMEGDIARFLQTHLARIAHVQIADNPGRHEPGTGEIDYRFLFRHLDAIGYAGWVGCEYRPRAQTLAGLGWMRELAGTT